MNDRRDLFQRGQDSGILTIDEDGNQVTYHLGREAKYVWSDPEEPVRAAMILSLVFNYQYSPLRMETEVRVPHRTPGGLADVVVFRDDRRRDPFIVVEATAPDTSASGAQQKIEQLFGYANSLASEYGIYTNGSTNRVWRVRGEGGLEREHNEVPDLPVNYGQVPSYQFVRGTDDLIVVDAHKLAQVFDKCHNDLWSGGRFSPIEAFDEISKLIFAKLYDEQNTETESPYGFQWGDRETDIMVASRVRELYQSARLGEPDIFSAELRSEPRKIANVVKNLQHISLVRTDPDAKGRAFEQFLGEVFRGRLGQYFTRREIVEFLVSLAEPTKDDLLLDPACGSGGFLVYAMKHVFDGIETAYRGDDTAILRHKLQYAQKRVFGVEINETIARAAMMDMVINDDGHTNIEIGSSLKTQFDNDGLVDGKFTMVLTNPPFGDNVKNEQRDKLGDAELDDYELAKGKKSSKSEVLFIERCCRFLGEGGKMGMVVPSGVLSNPSEKKTRMFLLSKFCIHAIVSLPEFAFRKSGSGMKTSVMLASKRAGGHPENQPIFMAIADHIGYDATARPDRNDLPPIRDAYKEGSGEIEDKVVRVRKSNLGNSFRLDPLYHYLRPVIQRRFESIPHPDATLAQLANGPILSGKAPEGGATYSTGSIPIILIGHMGADGTVNVQRDPCFVEEEFYETNKNRAAVQPLDILIAKDGATTGKVALVPVDFGVSKCLFNEHIFRVKVGDTLPGDKKPSDSQTWQEVNTRYVFFFLKSSLGQQQVEREISGGAQGGITKTFVDNIRVPILPPNKRRQWVAEMEERYSKYLQGVAESRRQYIRLSKALDGVGQ